MAIIAIIPQFTMHSGHFRKRILRYFECVAKNNRAISLQFEINKFILLILNSSSTNDPEDHGFYKFALIIGLETKNKQYLVTVSEN